MWWQSIITNLEAKGDVSEQRWHIDHVCVHKRYIGKQNLKVFIDMTLHVCVSSDECCVGDNLIDDVAQTRFPLSHSVLQQ